MNFLERRALARAERQLDEHLRPGEEIVDFDNGTAPNNQRVDLILSTHALYEFDPRRRSVGRIPLELIADVVWDPSPFWHSLQVRLYTGQRLMISLKHPRELADTLVGGFVHGRFTGKKCASTAWTVTSPSSFGPHRTAS